MLPAEYRISDENPRWTPHTAYYANFLAFSDNPDHNILVGCAPHNNYLVAESKQHTIHAIRNTNDENKPAVHGRRVYRAGEQHR
jgi:hypothetical protein